MVLYERNNLLRTVCKKLHPLGVVSRLPLPRFVYRNVALLLGALSLGLIALGTGVFWILSRDFKAVFTSVSYGRGCVKCIDVQVQNRVIKIKQENLKQMVIWPAMFLTLTLLIPGRSQCHKAALEHKKLTILLTRIRLPAKILYHNVPSRTGFSA